MSAPQLTPAKFLTDAEYDHFMSLLFKYQDSDPRNTTLLKLLAHTGARASEILNLRPVDLFPETFSVMIRGLKNSNDRLLPLGQDLFMRTVALIPPGANLQNRIFPIRYNRLRDIWLLYRPCKKKVHSLRHTVGVRVYRKTKDLKKLRKVLGHRCIQNTLIYVDYEESQADLFAALM